MNKFYQKVHIREYVLIIFCILIAQIIPAIAEEDIKQSFSGSYAEDIFTPPATFVPLYSEPQMLARSNNTIMLDSSNIKPQEFNIDFLSPSEYQTKIYKKTENGFTAEDETQPEKQDTQSTNTQSETKNEPEQTPQINEFSPITEFGTNSLVRKDEKEESATNYLPFNKPDEFLSPSEYKIKLETKSKPNVSEELIPEFPYMATVNNESPDDVADGRTISSIKIKGLSKIKDDLILNTIKSSPDRLFSTELVQMDLQRIYATGYFTENMSAEPFIQGDGTVELVFELQENIIVNDIKITGNTVYFTPELMLMLKPLKNMPQNINKINESIKCIDEYYKKDGYILAYVDSVDDTKDGTLIIHISEGIIEKFEFNEDKKTKDFVIERNILTKPGSVYNEEILKQDITRLYATQIFEDIERTIEQSPDKKGEYIVKIKVKEASSNNVSIGAGVDSALGLFGQISVNEKNFLGRGQFLGISGMIGSGIMLSDSSIKNRMNYNVELTFREPYFLNADNSLAAKAYYRDLGSYQIPLAIERRFGFNGVITHKFKGYDNIKASLGAGFENIHLSEGDLNRITTIYNMRNISITERAKQLTGGSFFNISPSVTYSTVDDEFMPRQGMIATAGYTESIGLSRIKNTNGRVVGRLTKYIPVFKKSTLSLTARGGARVHGDMPEIMAFSLGGPYSIRGFRMNGVGTGNAFLMGSAELQTPIPFFDRFKYDILKNMRFAFFVDAGKVFDGTLTSVLYDRPMYAVTAGIGLRINIPRVGPLSIDYALPFTNTGQYNPNGGYFTFGMSGLYDNY